MNRSTNYNCRMRTIFSSLLSISKRVLLAGLTSLGLAGLSLGQSPGGYTVPPQRLEASRSGADHFPVLASLTMVEAAPDDTVRGRLVLTIDEATRARLRQPSSRLTGEPPEIATRQEVRLRWRRGTACPDLELELPALRFDYLGMEMTTRPGRLRLEVAAETTQPLPQLLCHWTRQINSRRPRQGLVLAINRLLSPAEEPPLEKER
jgi:hypothetical protein